MNSLRSILQLYHIDLNAHLLDASQTSLILWVSFEMMKLVPPLRHNSSQKRQNQWCRWSENIIPALVKPYLYYLEASQSLHVVINTKVGDQSQCPMCTVQQLTVYCLFFDCVLAS